MLKYFDTSFDHGGARGKSIVKSPAERSLAELEEQGCKSDSFDGGLLDFLSGLPAVGDLVGGGIVLDEEVDEEVGEVSSAQRMLKP